MSIMAKVAFTHPFTASLTHPFTHSLTCTLTHSLTHSRTVLLRLLNHATRNCRELMEGNLVSFVQENPQIVFQIQRKPCVVPHVHAEFRKFE